MCHATKSCCRGDFSSEYLWAWDMPRHSTDVAPLTRVATLCVPTDGGMSVAAEQRAELDGWVSQLGDLGRRQRPLKDERLFGNWNVVYTSTGKAAGNSSRACVGEMAAKP
eukprot:363596-Chlamydomonas_euryale.AAC.14